MEAFVIDFFATLGIDTTKDTKLLDMYREIFKNLGMFKEFLKYAQKNNFSFLENQTPHSDDRVLYLYICDFLRGITLEKIEDILQLSKPDMRNQMSQAIPGFNFTFYQALQTAIYCDIAFNNRGEVLYVVKKVGEEYEVFSYESGFHQVNQKGEVIVENIQNKTERRKVLGSIRKYKRFLKLYELSSLEDENDIHLTRVIMQNFAKQHNIDWHIVSQDEKQVRMYLLKLQSYIFFKILDLEKRFSELQGEEKVFLRKKIVLVGGMDMWD